MTSAPSSRKISGADRIGRAVRAVEHDPEPAQAQILDGAFRILDIAAARILDAVGFADVFAGNALFRERAFEHLLFNFKLDRIRQLEAVLGKNLDAVVAGGLWLTVIMMPQTAPIDRVRWATAGVGIGPTARTSIPMLRSPLVIAFSSI